MGIKRSAAVGAGGLPVEPQTAQLNIRNKPAERIVELIHHALLQRNDRVVGDLDFFRTHLGAALGDVAVADAEIVLQTPCSRSPVSSGFISSCAV